MSISGPHEDTITLERPIMDRKFAEDFLKSDPAASEIKALGFQTIVFVSSSSGQEWRYSWPAKADHRAG